MLARGQGACDPSTHHRRRLEVLLSLRDVGRGQQVTPEHFTPPYSKMPAVAVS